MEEKIKKLKEEVVRRYVNSYDNVTEFDWQRDDTIDVENDGFFACARIFLTDEEMEDCNIAGWTIHMTKQGYSAEQAEEIRKETLETIKSGVEYLKANPEADFSNLD